MKNIMFIAPPAAGKGTQAELITAKYKLPHISTGDILREIAKEDSEIGNYVAETLASGKLVKDDITYKLIEERLARDDCKNGYIIDGFPRNLEQAIEYDKILADLGYEVGNVILLNIEPKTLEKRITGRRVCEDCHTIFNINDPDNTPQVESVCDNCGGRLYQRNDDNLEAFQTRYAMYLEKTAPIIEHYRKQNVLHEVNGEDTVENVFKHIDEIISKN
ncbi:MAG: adenylate kinase [Mycoplasmatota bacterium]|nr:adenylate kinase [Mycoplasmatota bacterium]